MKLKSIASAAFVALTAALVAPAQAATITNADGANQAWTGFDWDANGTAFTTGFQPVAGDTFQLGYFAWAATLKNGAANLTSPGLDNNADGVAAAGKTYEYTVVATLNEQVQSCTGNQCTFNVLNGTYSIYYDLARNANALSGSLGTGFTDGILLISGTFGAQAGGSFTVSGPGGFGITSLLGSVSSTNTTYINPMLASTSVTTTLQLGSFQTNGYVSPGGFNGAAFESGAIVFQADANQSFVDATVPEPISLALVGSALIAGGWVSRRRIKK